METGESEREEGEIVDDELEDVSDCSITSPFHLGKSVSATERLRPVSLSSISDSDLEDSRSRKNGHYFRFLKSSTPYGHPKTHRRGLLKRKRRQGLKQKPAASSSDSEDEKLDRKTLQQLKEAVRIESSREIHQNSLRSRLKALIEPVSEKSQTEDEDGVVPGNTSICKPATDQNVQEIEDSGKEKKASDADITDDKELAELRLEALKSAMLKKHLERKKRKALEKEQKVADKLENNDINKENTVDNINREETNDGNANKKICLEETKKSDVSLPLDEDVDIMRAMLLASMSRKITEESEMNKNLIGKEPEPAPTKPLTRSVVNRSSNFNLKPIKRTIKNNYCNNKLVYNAKTANKNHVFKPSVPTVEPLIININNDSDSDMDIEDPEENDITKSVTDFLNQQRAEVEAKKVEKQVFPLDKSVMRLLPFSQQIEYQRLKQQLNAKKNVKLFKLSANEGDLKLRNVKNKNVVKSKFTFIKQNIAVKDRNRNIKSNKIDKRNTSSLQQTLNDMQTQKDGRLQVKGKYQELAPILKKVNQVSVERKRYENEIKRLLQELEKTKQKFSASHQNFKNLVEELIRKKESIDKCTSDSMQEKTKSQKDPISLTPLKTKNLIPTNQNKLEDGTLLATSTPIIEKGGKELIISTSKESNTDQELELKTEKDIQHIVDPNDLNEQIMNQIKISASQAPNLPKYVSPLDKRENDFLTSDPLAMLCPFDLLGVCKDKECTYKHCS